MGPEEVRMIILKFFLDHVIQTFKYNRKRRERSPRKEKGLEEMVVVSLQRGQGLSLIHISEPTRLSLVSRMPSSA